MGKWRENRDMSTIDDVIYFFETEIERSKLWRDCTESDCFNGVQVGLKEAKKLQDRHIKYCQNIIDRIRSNSL
mgnify:CR=1 FL=1|jgi:hypothetical protein